VKLAGLLAAVAFAAQAQTQLPDPGKRDDKPAAEEAKPAPLPPKPRPRVSLKPKGGTGSHVGDDAPGGGATTAEPSRGGTPGTPSGSFTGPPSKP
jgi:hypothetical protein